MSRRWRNVALALALTLAAGCGASDTGVSQAAGAQFRSQVDAIRSAAVQGNRSAAARRLAQLLATVAMLRAKGELSDSAAARIRRAAAGVNAELSLLPAPSTTTTSTTSPAEPDAKPRGKRDDAKGHSKD